MEETTASPRPLLPDPTGITQAEYQAWVDVYNTANGTSKVWTDLQSEFADALAGTSSLTKLQILIWIIKQHPG